MELYSMPQLDKSSLVYSDVHYVGRSNLSSTGIPVDVKKFSPVTGDILTSSAWSAVIHRPAEDSEPEDLPSTVDMDAIKGSPTSSLPPAGPLVWQDSDRGQGRRPGGQGGPETGADDDSGSDDDDDDDDDSSSDGESSSPNSDGEEADSESETAQGSASDSDSDSSSQNSYDSDSESGSSDSSCSSQSSGSSQSSPSPTPKQFPHRELEKRAVSQEHLQIIGEGKMKLPSLKSEEKDNESPEDRRNQPVSSSKEDGKGDEKKLILKEDAKECKNVCNKESEESEEQKRKDKQEVGRVALRNRQVEEEDDSSRGKPKETLNRPSSSRNVHRKEEENQRRSTVRSKLINEEDLAAILPDVGAAAPAAIAAFNPFDEENSHGGRGGRRAAGPAAASANDSSSDVELPDQVVNDAIKRIQIDSEDKSGTADCADQDDDTDSDSSDAESRRKMYSSSLLQQFVERTERLSGKRSSTGSSGGAGGRGLKESARRRRVRAAKPSSTRPPLPPPPPGAAANPAELEVYCSVSNVSPDSGIYCVNGSPWHQSSPAHSPQHPSQQKNLPLPSPPHAVNIHEQRRKNLPLKAKPARKAISSVDRHKEMRVPPIHPLQDSDDDQAAPPSPLALLSAPTRRGPGRPKKAPPVLEPCLPLQPKQSRSGAGPAGGGKQRRKECGSERCDSSTCRGRGPVQVTSQGVQCDQSEFRQLGLVKVKKKKNQSSSRGGQGKTSNHVKTATSSSQKKREKEKSHRSSTKPQSVCDRFSKKSEGGSNEGRKVAVTQQSCARSAKSCGSVKEALFCHQSSSTSKRKLPTSVEKRKKGRRKSHAARLAAAAAALLSGSARDVTTPTAKPTKPEKVVSLPRALKPHHKHKKHRRRKGHKSRSRHVDPNFLSDLEKLIADFQRCCCIARLQVPTSRGEGSPSTRLPSIFRVRRIGKKRKGSERSRNSDRDSGPEADTPTPVISAAPRDSRDKGSSGGKRRVKKSAVETPKGQRPETNNEQRLPLKKRHYHMSATPNHQSPSTSSPESLDVSSSADDKHSNNESPSSISSKSSLISVTSQGSKCNASVTTGNTASISNTLSNAVSKSVSESSSTPSADSRVTMGVKGSPLAGSVNKINAGAGISTNCLSPSASESCNSSPMILSKAESMASFAGVCEKADLLPESSKSTSMPEPTVTKVYPSDLPSAVSSSADVSAKPDPINRVSPETTTPDTSNQLEAVAKVAETSIPSPSASKPLVSSTVSCSSKASGTKDVVTKPTSTSSPSPALLTTVADSSVCSKAVSSEPDQTCAPEIVHASSSSSPTSTCTLEPIPVRRTDSPKPVRNTVDEAIEACISRYACDIPSSSPRAVITTPKKRHRIELQGKSGGGKGKEQEAKRSNARASCSATAEITAAPAPAQSQPSAIAPPALSPGGSKLPESGIFEPSSSSENYIVDVSLPATPVKSAIAGLSKLKGTASAKSSASSPSTPKPAEAPPCEESLVLTCHNLRQKKSAALAAPAVETAAQVKCEADVKTQHATPVPKTKQKSKGKAKSEPPASIKTETVSVSCESQAPPPSASKGGPKQDLKEVRIHVEKLTSLKLSPEASGTSAKQKARRRKCNRTGFPVKRKKKKKDATSTEDKTGAVNVKSEVSPETCSTDAGRISQTDTAPSEEISELRSSSRVQNRKEKSGKEIINNIVKVEHKDEGESVISTVEDCTAIPKGIKDEAVPLEPSDEVSSSTEGRDMKAQDPCPLLPSNCAIPTVTRLPNKEKYMFCGDKLRKPSKAVIRAMRAKFSENSITDLPLKSKSSRCRRRSRLDPSTWSSDDSDDSSENLLPLAVRQELEEAARSERLRSKGRTQMKRPAGSPCEEQLKSKVSKTGKEDSVNSKNSVESRTRNKRKNELNDGPSSADLRHARSKKRSRTSQRMEADSMESDGDESMCEPLPTPTPCPADVLSEDDLPRIDGKDIKQPRWRKKYLPAGLFSEYFKLDEPRPVGESSKKCLQYKPEEHPHGLLPPPYHCGKYLRQRRVNFQLPYDLWWLHMHNQLPGRDLVPSWNYKKIRTNVYFNVKPAYMHEPQACNCKAPENGEKGCGDDCINRLVYAECAPALCPLRDLCSNQRIQRHEWAPGLDRFMTKEKGWGIRTKLPIKTGEFILEYVGEVVSDKEFKERMASRYTRDTHHYCLHLDGGLVIDGHRMGGDGRFVNHSCEPNCEMQKWSVNGLFRMALFALRNIEPMEELGYDYNFSLFNPADGQPCKCGSTQCRGVIGGKSQRVTPAPATQNGTVSKVSVEDVSEKKANRKNKRKACRRNEGDGERAGAAAGPAAGGSGTGPGAGAGAGSAEGLRQQRKRMETQRLSQLLALNIRHMSHQQRCFVQQHHCFLLRNLEKVRRLKEKLKQATQRTEGFTRPPANVKQADVFLTQLNALSTPRNVRTRRLAQAEDDPELARNIRLACILRDLYSAVITAKDEKGEALSSPFMTLPNKRKVPLYYERIREPLDFSTIEQNINSGLYSTVEAFDQDICKVINNNIRFYGRISNLGIASARLRKIYVDAKKEVLPQLTEVLGDAVPSCFIAEKNPAEEEEVIRCICGLYRDEGLMIQCERCMVWQHCDCVKGDSSLEYLCEQCQPREVDLEIIMDPQPSYASEGQTEYVTLLRNDLQIRQGDTVYVLRDLTEGEGESQCKVTYKTIKDPKYADMDIFRIERLWKDEKGERFAFGHHYLRPHETYHEPTRKFYPNEVMRVPLYEIISLDLIWARCWVLDPAIYCKGRPVEAVEEHVYICEYRVDKSAHLFYKISKSQSRANICTKSYAFETFDVRLKPVRTYTPHGPVPSLKPKNRGNQDDCSSTKSIQQMSASVDDDEEEMPLAKRERQRSHLNKILLRLLSNQQCKQPLDVSYLLEPGRRHRKKPASLST